eukprot:UN27058
MFWTWKVMPSYITGPNDTVFQTLADNCQDKNRWVRNIFYVQNVSPWDESNGNECFGHAWYLANDMQFAWLSPLFIYTYVNHEMAGITLTAGICFILTVVTTILCATEKWSAITFHKYGDDYSKYFYSQPYARMPAYLVGMLFAMIWLKYFKDKSFKFTDTARNIITTIALSLFFTLTYGSYRAYNWDEDCTDFETTACSDWTRTEDVLWAGLTRPVWCIALSLLAAVCFTGQGSVIQEFLEADFWVPIARISFCMYLVHI